MSTVRAELNLCPFETRRPEEIVAHCAFVNDSAETLTISVIPLSAPSLCLEIVDSRDSPMRLPPPPVPKDLSRQVVLMPGQCYSIEHAGFVPQWTPPGTYRARLRYISTPSSHQPHEWTGEVVSVWVEFTILEG